MGTNTRIKRTKVPILTRILVLLLTGIGLSVSAAPTASFSADQTSGCTPLSVQFTSTSTGAVSFYWDLGNGNTSTLANPTNLYSTPGSYTISLIAYDAAGNSDTATYTNYITVIGKPAAHFSSSQVSSCLDNNSYTFTNSSTGAATYLWDFGDGTTSTQTNPTHSYSLSGSFTVTLIATNTFGCQDVRIRNQYITIFPKPDASIIANTTASCDPSTSFQFSNAGSNITSWTWTFGDGNTSSAQNPSHTYTSPGQYNVSLMVTNSFGCRDTADSPTQINVGVSNWANFSVDEDSGCAPIIVNFTNLNANTVSNLWDFGDGTTSTSLSPSHTYTNAGVYTVTLIVTTSTGCTDTVRKPNLIVAGVKPTASFIYTNSVGCGPLSVQFTNTSQNFVGCQWFFGDGTNSMSINPTHTYTNSGTFDVTLKCWSATGCIKSIVYRGIVKVTSTEAMFTATPRIGCPPLDVAFTAFSPGTGLTYHWDFGDGNTSTQQNPSHTYNGTGNFDVTLIVTDSLGCSDTLRKVSYIRTANPAANYIPPPTMVGCAPLTTQFTDATVGANSWLWNFGDGTTSTSQNPVHTYSTPGFYTVSLTTTSAGGGCVQTINTFGTFDVRGGYAGFTHSETICPPYEATFTDTSLNAVSWFWDFGDGTTSTDQNPDHVFATPGYHSVSLSITTADGCTYSTMQSNSVYFAPFGAHFYGVPQGTTFPMPVQFYANSLGATSWLWDFGDSTTSTLQDPFHIYQLNGNYNVTLTISNGLCTLYYDPPPFNFGTPDTTPVPSGNPGIPEVQQGCAPLTVNFTNVIPGSVVWHWDFGDGDTSSTQFPNHTYENAGIYTVVLTTTDTLGIVQVFQMDSIVRVAGPRAGFIVTQTASCSNTEVTFVDTSQNAVFWEWEFGDGDTSSLSSPTHVYNSGMPNYIITQTVTDTMGCSSAISTSIYSNFISPLLASETEICGMDTVDFYTSLQNYASYLWDFGDGTTSTQQTPKHVYSQEGIFTATLTVTDQAGCTQSFQVNPPITVSLPSVAFTTTTGRQGCNGINIQFVNQSANADSYLWDFGDGTISSLENPIHSYLDPGHFDVSLTIFRGNCSSTLTYPQYIRVDTAYADFSVSGNSICLPFDIQFTDLSANAVSWSWDFGTGDSSNVQNPLYTFNDYSGLVISLAIVDVNGCRDTAYSPPPSPLLARFDASLDTGCIPMTVHFNNSSLSSSNYFWDFGDGTTSTELSPDHEFTQAGDYDVTLVVQASPFYGGCTDTLHMPAMIHAREPMAGFVTPDRYACAPSLVNFTDLSVDADTYLWDFGDSTTSTNSNPSHIYNNPGLYSVSLIVGSNAGCQDTLHMPDYIRVLGPITNFSANVFEGCAPFDVQFTDHSQDAVEWNWSFGDGYAEYAQHPGHTFQDTGTFTVSLVTKDTAGCSSYYELPQKIIVHPTPDAQYTTGNISGCQPFTATFVNTSTGSTSWNWNFGDGDTSSVQQPTHLFLDDGIFQVQLIASNAFGCRDTFVNNQPFNVLPSPVVSFTAGATMGCAPFQVNFFNYTTNVNGSNYHWDFGDGQTSTDAQPTVTYQTPGFYTVSLVVVNTNGCSDSISFPALIHVLDTLPPQETKIYSVSVTSNTTVEIKWENNPAIDLASYVLYRLNQNTQYYESIYTETNIQNTGFALENTFVDSGLNTLRNTYTYKVQALDICGNTIPLDQLTAHTTINVSSQRQGQDIFVSWTPYSGCPVSSYEIYRYESGEAPQYLATVPPDSLTYTDTTFDCPHPYSYRIKATDLCGTSYISYSDTSMTIPLNTLANQIVDVVRSTVVDNQFVLTEWKEPVVHPEKVAQFDIYRSTDNTNFSYVATVPSVQTDYADYGVDVQNNHYFYKILVINTCDITEDLSPITSTVLLKGEMNEGRQVHLEWTPYKGWEQGVEYYILEKMDENGHWQILKQVDGSKLQYDYQE